MLKSTFLYLKKYCGRNKDTLNEHKVRAVTAILFVILLIALYGIVYWLHSILPTALRNEDEKEDANLFISERAQENLRILTDIGPRVTGSYENEVLAVNFLKQEIVKMQKQAHPEKKLELDVQTASGLFKHSNSLIVAYGNVQNVVVKLRSTRPSEESILVNVHFDSAVTSPGGSDDGINCAVMLEVLRKLSQYNVELKYNVIVLFNGAEETGLQASHAFITQHKWAKEARVVINLEAAGAGGRALLFQVGPKQSWLVSHYAKVPYPSGQAFAEEAFQMRLINSDTDFRIFKQFGNLTGYDIAFVEDGYRYHTKFDGFDNIPAGSFQQIGDNVLSLVRNLANADELTSPQATGSVTYFDYFGLFMISYTEIANIVIVAVYSASVVIINIKSAYNFKLGFSMQTLAYFLMTLGGILLGWLLAGCVVTIIALILDSANLSLSWYSNTWLLFGLYVIPVVICTTGSTVLVNRCNPFKVNLTPSAHAQIQAQVLLLVWMIVLIIGTAVGLRSIYVILLPVVFQAVMFGMVHIFCLQHSIRTWQIMYLVATIIPNIFLMNITIILVKLFVPISGRMGETSNPEIFIGNLVLVCTILITSFYVPLITLVRNASLVLIVLFAAFVLFVIFVFTPLGFPYSGNPESPTPQIFQTYHVSRTFRSEQNEVYKKDSGFYLVNYDRNSPRSLTGYVKDLDNKISIVEDCKRSIQCGLPIRQYAIENAEKHIWIPAESPVVDEPVTLELVSKTQRNSSTTRFNFTVSGPNYLKLYISTRSGANLSAISLAAKLSSTIWNGRPLYVVFYNWGKIKKPLNFWIDISMAERRYEPSVDIAVVGIYVCNNINKKTPQYAQFIEQFPNWTNVSPLIAVYESWVY